MRHGVAFRFGGRLLPAECLFAKERAPSSPFGSGARPQRSADERRWTPGWRRNGSQFRLCDTSGVRYRTTELSTRCGAQLHKGDTYSYTSGATGSRRRNGLQPAGTRSGATYEGGVRVFVYGRSVESARVAMTIASYVER